MDTDNDLFLDLIESVTRDVLDRLGNDSDARYAFFRRFLEVARRVVRDAGGQGSMTCSR